MKKIIFNVLICLGLAAPAYAVDLRDATNRQLLDELQSRLSNGGGGGGQNKFSVNVICDGSYLEIAILNRDFVQTAKVEEYFGTNAKCKVAAPKLPFSANARVRAGLQFGICDGSYLDTYGLLATGKLKEINSLYQGTHEKCLTAMAQFNGQ